LPTHYNLTQDFEGFYSFRTDSGLSYSLYLIDDTESFFQEEIDCIIYQFGLILESTTDTDEILHDPKIEATVVEFIAKILDNQNCIIYTASMEGNKQSVRLRLFEWWFIRANKKLKSIQRYQRKINSRNHAILLIDSCNNFKDVIVGTFMNG
jgi:hypothetical protein